ncbi:MAG: HlyD family efflux transporter periplasmic adaptor subunit [Xanthomonadales bacterium]|nr:HlyD family efflux transporter periplasmic adaptor subunit [Xanthomonadales bacterium]
MSSDGIDGAGSVPDSDPFLGSRPLGPRLLSWAAGLLLLILLLAAAVVALVPWPRTVQAPFELVADGALPTLQAPLQGTVTRVAIRQGQTVAAGELLFEIRGDSLLTLNAQQAGLSAAVQAAAEEADRLQTTHRNAVAAAEREAELLRQGLAQSRQHESTLQTLLERKQQAVREGLLPEINLLDDRLLAAESTRERLLAEQRLARWAADQEQRLADHERALQALRLRQTSLQAELGATDAQLQDASAGIRQIRAAHAAVVLELFVADSGTVVAQGQTLARLVYPGLEVQARLQIAEHDLDLLSPGQPVRLLVKAYPYQRHGSVAATLSWVSPAGPGQAAATGFQALAQPASHGSGEAGPALAAGMSGEALILTDRQTLLQRFLEPLRGLRERAWLETSDP